MRIESSHAESHVPRFQERVGTRHPGYMIPDPVAVASQGSSLSHSA